MLNSMIKKIIGALFLGIILTLVALNHDKGLQEWLGTLYRTLLEKALSCSMKAEVDSINIMRGAVTFKDVRVTPENPQDEGWKWECDRLTISVSWFELITSFTFSFDIHATQLRLYSLLDKDNVAIAGHLKRMIEPPTLAIRTAFRELELTHAQCTIQDPYAHRMLELSWSSRSRVLRDRVKNIIYLENATLVYESKTLCANTSGNIIAEILNPETAPLLKAHINAQTRLPFLDENETYYLKGLWNNRAGQLDIHTMHTSCLIKGLNVAYKKDPSGSDAIWINGNGTCSLKPLGSLVQLSDLEGTAAFKVTGFATGDHPLECTVDITGLSYAGLFKGTHANINAQKKGSLISGTGTAQWNNYIAGSGEWIMDTATRAGALTFSNTRSILIPVAPLWHIPEEALQISLSKTPQGVFSASYEGSVSHVLKSETRSISGTLTKQGTDILIEGVCGSYIYSAHVSNQFPYIHQASCIDTDNNSSCLSLETSPENSRHLTLTIPFSTMRTFINASTGYDLQGTGDFIIQARASHTNLLMNIDLKDGTIRLAHTYNFINSFHAESLFDYARKQLVMRNVHCGMHTGSINSARVILGFDKTGICHAHVPFIFDRCLLNVHKDLFAMFSGDFLLTKRADDTPLIKAHFILDKAQLKENIFSSEFQNTFRQFSGNVVNTQSYNWGCDISIETKDALKVDTAFLTTHARAAVHITGTTHNPDVRGTVALENGILHFPYKPLLISKGEINFTPGNINNPLVELLARNTIKHHTVGLHVTGSLLDYHLSFDSSPHLADEQVIALLCVGSPDETLTTMVPALLIQNVGSLLFGSHQTALLENYFKPLHPSLNIHFVPSFSDQAGRGGLRGRVEIDVNDRWHAMLQKNFSLTEDTRVELEYLVSDDVSMRAVRDERRDMGAEVEMRWKW